MGVEWLNSLFEINQTSKIVSQMRICIDDCGTILCDYKRVILWFNLLTRLIDWICGNVILTWTQNIIQFGWEMDRRLLKWNCKEFLAMSLLEILCSSRSSCFSCVLRLRRFIIEVLRGFRGLNPKSFTDLWFVDVFRTFEFYSRKL